VVALRRWNVPVRRLRGSKAGAFLAAAGTIDAAEAGFASAEGVARITSGELKPGDRLPTQAQLVSDYAVSLQPVKLALKILETEGLVIGHQGNGVFVSQSVDDPEG
jgi:hypothetical protein